MTTDITRKEFMTQLADLMDKFGVTFEVRQACSRYSMNSDGLDIDFDVMYDENHDVIRSGYTLRVGNYIDEFTIREAI